MAMQRTLNKNPTPPEAENDEVGPFAHDRPAGNWAKSSARCAATELVPRFQVWRWDRGGAHSHTGGMTCT
jgi:hypothetical protein